MSTLLRKDVPAACKWDPEGCSFAILFMNVCTPLIDKWTTPKTFGAVKTTKKGGAKA